MSKILEYIANRGKHIVEILKEKLAITELGKEVFDIEANAILALKDRLGENFEKAIDIIYNCKGRTIITGMGKSGLIGKKIAATLSSTGTPSYFLHPAESTHGDSGIITRDDVVVAISNSGETAELLGLLPLIKRFGVKLIGMTGKMKSTLAQKSDVVLDIAVEKEACPLGKAPTASTTATLAMGDALAVCLLKKRGFSEEDFLVYHPSGALGKGILYHVDELMIKEEKLPICNIETTKSFLDIVKFVSEKKLGCAILVNKNTEIQGILTDGDIRRAILKGEDVSKLQIQNVMTKSPKTIKTTELAAKALQIMETYSITSIIVSDDGVHPQGLVHIHDLLKAGVA